MAEYRVIAKLSPVTGERPRLPGRRSHRQWVAWIALLLSSLIIVVVSWQGGTPAMLLLQLVAVLLLGGWFAFGLIDKAWRAGTSLMPPVVLLWTALLASLAFAQNKRLSLEPTVASLCFGAGLLMAARLLHEEWFRARFAALIQVAVGSVAIGYLIQVGYEWFSWWQIIGAVRVPPLRPAWAGFLLGSPILVATFLLIPGPLAVVLAAERVERRWPAILLAVLIISAIFVSGSRAGYLALLVALACMAGLVALKVRSPSQLRSDAAAFVRNPRFRQITLPVLILLIFAAPTIAHRFAQGGADIRLDLWRSAVAVFLKHPITGGGPGSWPLLKIESNPPGEPNELFSHAHNAPLQLLAELGVLGAIALAGLVATVLMRARQKLNSSRRADRLHVAGVLGGFVAFGVMAVVDISTNLTYVGALLVFLVGWLDGIPDRPETEGVTRKGDTTPPSRAHGRVVSVIGLLVIAALVPTYVRIDLAALESDAGNRAMLQGAHAEALEHFDAAMRDDPDFTLYRLQAASASAYLGSNHEALSLLSTAVSVDDAPVNLIGLAALEIASGRRTDAMQLARRAARLSPGDWTVALNAGRVGEAAGDLDFALDQFANATAWNPALLATNFWSGPDRRVARQSVVDAAHTRSGPLEGALILAYAGQVQAAEAELRAAPPSDRRDIYLAVVDWRAGRLADATNALTDRLESNPLDWEAAAWVSRMLRLSGDGREAQRYARWAFVVQADSAPAVIAEMSAIPPAVDAHVAGLPRDYPSGVYGRPTSMYLLIPELTLVGLR